MSYPRFVRTVRLRSGGELSIAIEASVRDLSGPDSAFLLGIIEAIDRYQAERQADAQAQQQRLSKGAGDV